MSGRQKVEEIEEKVIKDLIPSSGKVLLEQSEEERNYMFVSFAFSLLSLSFSLLSFFSLELERYTVDCLMGGKKHRK